MFFYCIKIFIENINKYVSYGINFWKNCYIYPHPLTTRPTRSPCEWRMDGYEWLLMRVMDGYRWRSTRPEHDPFPSLSSSMQPTDYNIGLWRSAFEKLHWWVCLARIYLWSCSESCLGSCLKNWLGNWLESCLGSCLESCSHFGIKIFLKPNLRKSFGLCITKRRTRLFVTSLYKIWF